MGLIPREAARTIASCCEATRFDVEELDTRDVRSGNSPPLVRALTAWSPKSPKTLPAMFTRGRRARTSRTAPRCLSPGGRWISSSPNWKVSPAAAASPRRRAPRDHHGRPHPAPAGAPYHLRPEARRVARIAPGGRRRIREARERGLAPSWVGPQGRSPPLGESGLSVLGEFARGSSSSRGTLGSVAHRQDQDRTDRGRLSARRRGAREDRPRRDPDGPDGSWGAAEPAYGTRRLLDSLPQQPHPLGDRSGEHATRSGARADAPIQAMVGEHERAIGAWHAEWEALSDALALTGGGAAAAVREVTEGLGSLSRKDAAESGGDWGDVMAENVTTTSLIASARMEAHKLVAAAARRAADGGKPFREELGGAGPARTARRRGRRGARSHGLPRLYRGISSTGRLPCIARRCNVTAGKIIELDHLIEGSEDAPVLVLSNSLGTTLEMWRDQAPALRERFRLARYDHRGHGRLPVPPAPWHPGGPRRCAGCWMASGWSASPSAASRSGGWSACGSQRSARTRRAPGAVLHSGQLRS